MSWTRPIEVLVEVYIVIWLLKIIFKPIGRHKTQH
jgi:hypothetical protein